MTSSRTAALALIVVLGAFCVALVASLVFLHLREEEEGVLASRILQGLKKELTARPDDGAVKEKIRKADVQLREVHFENRRKFEWAARMLLAAAIAWIASARWHASLRPKPPAVSVLGRVSSRESAVWRVAGPSAAGAIVFAALAIIAGRGSPSLPSKGESSTVAASRRAGDSHLPISSNQSQRTQPGGRWQSPTLRPATMPASQPGAMPGSRPAAEEATLYWPCFRGPGNIGLAGSGDWPTSWSVAQKHNIVWSTAIPAEGKSSPVVWGNRVFLSGGTDAQHHVMAFDRESGALLWDKAIAPPSRPEPPEIGPDTGFAAPSPAVDSRRVCAMFATGLLAAFDHDGKSLWSADLGQIDSMYGYASSILLFQGIAIVQLDQGGDAADGKSELVGLDAATGKILWSPERPVRASWTSPSLIQANGVWQVVTSADPFVIAYNPADGKELWRVDGMRGDVAPSPAFGGGFVFVAQEYAKLKAIRPGPDVPEAQRLAWEADKGLPDTSSPVSDGKQLMQMDNGGGVTFYDAQTGNLLWNEFLDSPANASPILAGKHAYIACTDGVTRVLDWSPKYRLASQNDVGEPVHATPAFVGGRVYIRGESHLFCVGESGAEKPPKGGTANEGAAK